MDRRGLGWDGVGVVESMVETVEWIGVVRVGMGWGWWSQWLRLWSG